MPVNKDPYISFVVTSRNDNHGGNMTQRMQIFMNALLHQTRKHQLNAELVFVEWNPPRDRPLLKEILPAPDENDYLTVRYIIVPKEVHDTYPTMSSKMPLFQMTAKNVGIRRAKGRFVLCTNVDLLFSDPLINFLSQKNLDDQFFYRANRCDVPNELSLEQTVDEQLAFCEGNIIRTLGSNPKFNFIHNAARWIYGFPRVANLLNRILHRYMRRKLSDYEYKTRDLETNACGDFTLMAKDKWFEMRGYAELDLYSLHIDSLGLYAALSIELRQKLLPVDHCTYHLDHPNGWEAIEPKDRIRFLERLPSIDMNSVYDVGKHALNNKTKLLMNDEHWGFANHTFKEFVLSPSNTPSNELKVESN